MSPIENFLQLVDTYCGLCGIADATLSTRLFNDGKRIAAIRAGGDVGARRLQIAINWFSANWPRDTKWPAGAFRLELATAPAVDAERAP